MGLVEQFQEDLLVWDYLTVYRTLLHVGYLQLLVLGYSLHDPIEDVIVIELVLGHYLLEFLL